MRKFFLIFCSSVVLTAVVSLVGLTSAHDDDLFTTVSRTV